MRKDSLLVASLAAALMASRVPAGPAAAFQQPDTGQTTCYQTADPWSEVACGGTGQDGAYLINPPSYTDNGNGTVTDTNTGLTWQQDTFDTGYTWYKASGTYHNYYNPDTQDLCGTLWLGGYDDWRLPTKKELVSIVDYAASQPAADTSVFPGTQTNYYWSSTVHADPALVAGCTDFWDGSVSYHETIHAFYVRCVRGEQTGSLEQLVDNADATVTDGLTNLTWQQDEVSVLDWASALAYCDGLERGGYGDWRLPSVKELDSITDDGRSKPATDSLMFPSTHASYYWSSTSSAYDPANAWGVHFSFGFVNDESKATQGYYAKCVRGGMFDVSGRIRTNQGLPLPGVTLRLLKDGGLVKTARTNRLGRFRIGQVSPGAYVLKPVKRGWSFRVSQRLITVTDADITGRTFVGAAR